MNPTLGARLKTAEDAVDDALRILNECGGHTIQVSTIGHMGDTTDAEAEACDHLVRANKVLIDAVASRMPQGAPTGSAT